MVQIASIAVFASLFVSLVSAAPLPAAIEARAGAFKLQNYAQFQISGGVAGKAAAEANAVFVGMLSSYKSHLGCPHRFPDPFNGVNLATVGDQVAKDVETMRQAAEAAETDKFNPAIKAATGAKAAALQVGKIKNKVLKLTGECQVLRIKIAQAEAAGKDSSSLKAKLATEQ
ncbi:hypothetical protein H0H81_002128 [Sphagnurus paluster]|uniref:Small secreted protein n=1 Tax=Sphagnurus paluster TaxID=117069 RepID=A0A9P7GN72_9AGAR|nr:hypothetical protein H0H81_002128 [Sphagnurus paluster]